MSTTATFLHITDVHLTQAGSPMRRDDTKVEIEAADVETRETALDLTFEKLAERIKSENITLSGVLFCGDAQNKGAPGGHDQLLAMLTSRFGSVGISNANIVATPGNHDVPKNSKPGSRERYKAFVEVWRKAGCVTPWLDGLDNEKISDATLHSLVDPNGLWAVFPLNSSNWSQSKLPMSGELKKELAEATANMPDAVGANKDQARQAFRKLVDPLLEKLLSVDMARISRTQLAAMRPVGERR